MQQNKNILIVGIGNILRGDDGIGNYVCNCINRMHIKNVKSITTQQLDTSLLEDFTKADAVVLVDAALSGHPVAFYAAGKNNSMYAPASHSMNANLLVELAQQLYKKNPQLMICAVRGDNFNMGENLSDTAKQHADDAINTIVNWIKNRCC